MKPNAGGAGGDSTGAARRDRPEDIIYRQCYAPVDLGSMLSSAETRGKIRKLPGPQLYFGLQQLSDEEIKALLPHITEQQWTAVLDLDLWSRDRVKLDAFVGRHRFLMETADPVARKLLRGVDAELWQLLFRSKLKIHRRGDEEFEGEPSSRQEWFTTPDEDYLMVLPSNPDLARVLRPLLLRRYQLEPEATRLDLESALFRTSLELEEAAYQERKRRIEDLGFQDYFDAISIYTYIAPGERLPDKEWRELRAVESLPVVLQAEDRPGLLLFHAIDRVNNPRDRELLLEEIAYVTNKVLAADRAPAVSRERVKRGIRKALCAINLGLDVWSSGQLELAREGVLKHYLQSFFQYGYSRLIDLRRQAEAAAAETPPAPGSLQETFLEGILKPFPLRTVQTPRGLRRRFLETRRHLENCRRKLDHIQQSG